MLAIGRELLGSLNIRHGSLPKFEDPLSRHDLPRTVEHEFAVDWGTDCGPNCILALVMSNAAYSAPPPVSQHYWRLPRYLGRPRWPSCSITAAGIMATVRDTTTAGIMVTLTSVLAPMGRVNCMTSIESRETGLAHSTVHMKVCTTRNTRFSAECLADLVCAANAPTAPMCSCSHSTDGDRHRVGS